MFLGTFLLKILRPLRYTTEKNKVFYFIFYQRTVESLNVVKGGRSPATAALLSLLGSTCWITQSPNEKQSGLVAGQWCRKQMKLCSWSVLTWCRVELKERGRWRRGETRRDEDRRGQTRRDGELPGFLRWERNSQNNNGFIWMDWLTDWHLRVYI